MRRIFKSFDFLIDIKNGNKKHSVLINNGCHIH